MASKELTCRNGPPHLRIGLATEIRSSRRTAWSGTIRYMTEALQTAGAEISVLDPVWEWPTLALGLSGKIMHHLTGTDPMFNRSRTMSRFKARTLLRRLRTHPVDALFAPVGSTLIPDMPDGIPIIYTSDATVRLMQDYYGRFGKASTPAGARAIAMEAAALRRADLLIYPTHWAATSAIEDYGVDPARILVQPFGANLSDPPSREEALQPRRLGPLRLLFCGVEWERKGGDVALQATAALRDAGVQVELTILGCRPPRGALSDPDLKCIVTVVPFLNKALPTERDRFRQIFLAADILILPTRAECYGLVFCEAAASGTVSIAPATGGVPEVIRDGITGRVLPPDSTGGDYAAAVLALAQDMERLGVMRTAARDDFEARLNWGVWADTVLGRFLQDAARIPQGRKRP